MSLTVFTTKADAKINHFIPLFQIFSHLFSNFFQELPFQSGWGLCQACFTNRHDRRPIESGCKFTDFILFSKFSVKNFWSFLLTPFLSVTDKNFCNPLYLCIRTSLLSTCTIRTIRFYLIAAAKINQLLLLFQIFLPLFSRNYEDLLPPTLRSASYNRNFFYNRRIQGTEKEREKGTEEGEKKEESICTAWNTKPIIDDHKVVNPRDSGHHFTLFLNFLHSFSPLPGHKFLIIRNRYSYNSMIKHAIPIQ